MANSIRLALAVLTVIISGVSVGSAQITEFRKIGNKTIECMHSGLMSDLNDCGFRSEWYTYVFVGSLSAIKPTNSDEKTIQVTPEEVFSGEPSTPLTVLTSQGACLPTLEVGDRWLFYLRKENGKPIVLDYYGNDSRPIDSAQEEVETLRKLKSIGNLGIIRGSVESGPLGERRAVPGAQVVASRKLDKAQFFAATDDNGRFEFAPLTPGAYKLTVDPMGSFRPNDSGVDVKSGSCWNVTISKSPHGRISGRVRHPDGSPAPGVRVLIIDADGSGFNTIESDANGSFSSDGMTSGKYMVVINSPDAPRWKMSACGGICDIPQGALYYPWMHDRSDALVIELSDDEKRNGIDFTIPKK